MNHLNVKKIVKNFRHALVRTGSDPYFDWALILAVSSVVAAVFIGFGAKQFLQIGVDAARIGMSSGGSDASSNGPSLDTADLDNLISIFQSKNAQLPVFSVTYPGPSDPAIPLAAIKDAVVGSASSSSAAAGTGGATVGGSGKMPAKTSARTASKVPVKAVSK